MIDVSEITDLLSPFSGRKVLVVGDLCLDEYLIGRAERLSREAPVPVLEFLRRFTLPGAAANPALNLQALGAQVTMVGVVGADHSGDTLRQSLEQKGIDTSGVVVAPYRGTTVKTRVMAEVSLHFPQQLARIDYNSRDLLEDNTKKQVLEFLPAALDQADAVLLSDYKGGVVDDELVNFILRRDRSKKPLVTVDSQGNLGKFRGVDLIKCNQGEAEATIGYPLDREEKFRRAALNIKRRLRVDSVVITRGQDGMSLVDGEDSYLYLPATNKSEVFDVTGAGDTVIATLTLALVSGASLAESAYLANCAAGLAVRKLGNATVSREELMEALLLAISLQQ